MGSLGGSILVGVYGTGAILSAVFPTDRIDSPADVWTMSPTSSIHVVVFVVSFVCVIAGMFVLTPTFWRLAQWRSLAPWLVLFPSGALALLVVQTEGPWVGLMQRLLVGTVLLQRPASDMGDGWLVA